MPSPNRPTECRRCGAQKSDAVTISARGLCYPCGDAAMVQAERELATKSGPTFDKWRRSMLRALAS